MAAPPKLTAFIGNDGHNGPAEAVAFINAVDDAMVAGNFADARMAGHAKSFMTGAVAQRWLVLEKDEENAGLALWSTLRVCIHERWVRTLSMMEVRTMMEALKQGDTESVDAFQERVRMAHINEDRTLTDAVKAEAGYRTNVQRRVRRAFLAGLRSKIRDAMVGVNPDTATLAEMLVLARNAEAMSRQVTATAGAAAVDSIASAPPLSPSTQRVVDAVYQRMRDGKKANRGGGGGDRRGDRPPRKEYRGTCGRCGLVDSHATADCVVNLEKMERRGKGKFAKKSGGGRGGGRVYASTSTSGAARDDSDDESYPTGKE
jgi:hypothetical protein